MRRTIDGSRRVEFEWDENKRNATLLKHGIDFVRASRVFDDFVLEWETSRSDEHRIAATGMVDRDYITVVYTWRGPRRRIITARSARTSERLNYERARRAHYAGQAD